MAKRSMKPPVNILTPDVIVTAAILTETERFREDTGSKRLFINTVPIAINLNETDGSIKAHKGKMYASAAINKNPKADAFFADPNNPIKQHECPVCSGNRGRSGPEYSGDAAAAIAAVLFPHLERYKLAVCEHNPGGWYLFDMFADDAESAGRVTLPKKGGFYIAYKYKFRCPVHGVIEPIVYEPTEF